MFLTKLPLYVSNLSAALKKRWIENIGIDIAEIVSKKNFNFTTVKVSHD